DLCFVQLVNTTRTRTMAATGVTETMSSAGSMVLDTVGDVPYAGGVWSVGAGNTASIPPNQPANDSPGARLRPTQTGRSVDDSFHTYFMFRPTGGIWVTLGKMEWSWKGSAAKTAAGWAVVAGSTSFSQNPTWASSTKL